MAKISVLGPSTWRQSLADRKANFSLWGIPRQIVDACSVRDGSRRSIHLIFDNGHEYRDEFTITSGCEVYFPTDLQVMVREKARTLVSITFELVNDQSFDDYRGVVEDIEKISSEAGLTETERKSLIFARVGQGEFRRKLLERHGKCCLIGLRHASLLVASHIKPWRDSTNAERLDVENGILLSSSIDRLFDSHLISFDENGELAISPEIDAEGIKRLSIEEGMKIQMSKSAEKYMRIHRSEFEKKMGAYLLSQKRVK
jgi:hypothetical protein